MFLSFPPVLLHFTHITKRWRKRAATFDKCSMGWARAPSPPDPEGTAIFRQKKLFRDRRKDVTGGFFYVPLACSEGKFLGQIKESDNTRTTLIHRQRDTNRALISHSKTTKLILQCCEQRVAPVSTVLDWGGDRLFAEAQSWWRRFRKTKPLCHQWPNPNLRLTFRDWMWRLRLYWMSCLMSQHEFCVCEDLRYTLSDCLWSSASVSLACVCFWPSGF